MAYYAALVSAVQSVEKINSGVQCSEFFLDKQQSASIYEKLSHLQALLEDYSPEDEVTADCLETRIRVAAYQVQDTFDDCLLISELKRKISLQLQDVEKLKEEVDSIVVGLMRMEIKKSHTRESSKRKILHILTDRGLALVSVVKSLEKINSGDQCSEFFPDKQQIASIYEKLSHLQALLENYSLEDEATADCLERCSELFPDKQQIASIYERLSHLQALLDNYSPEDEATADCLERRIRDAEYQAQDTLDDCLLLSDLKRERPRQLQDMEKVKEEVDSIVKELMRMKIKSNRIRPSPKRKILLILAERGLDLVSVVQSLEEINSGDQCFKFFLDKQQIACVCEKLSHWQALNEVYSPEDEVCLPEDEAAAACLERRITDAAYQVQGTLDDCLISKLKREIPRQLQGMEKVKEEVDSIVEELMRMKIKKSHATEDLRPITYYPAPKQESTSCGDTTVGFEERLITIKEQLCGESSKLEIVPLVGMGGIGKTTLARSSFYDELIVDRFDCRAWVTVSQDYHVQKAFIDILESLNVDKKELSGADVGSLIEKIYKHLKGRRYLIIMDDVWDPKVWDDMKRVFPDDNNGSRIILTTRLSDVAVYANKRGSFYQMHFLNEDQSWNLLQDKVFAQEDCPRELEVIGRSIAQSCGGLPLAIVVVAGLLSKVSKARDDWEEVARNVSSTATENDDNLSQILSLSYNRLPNHLKPCFLYIGGFPEDYQISVSRLIKLWVAEGFLKQDEVKSLEEIGEEYFEDLVKRNLVLVTQKKSNGKFKCCSIHDVLRDLCVKRARKESFFHVVDNDGDNLYTEGTRNIIRRLYIHPACSQIIEVEELGPQIGSLLCFFESSQLLSFARGFKPLRVLDALEIEFRSCPVEVWELSRLRYLALSPDSGLFCKSIIPPWIVKLENLQTIVLRFDARDAFLFEIWKMPNLRHVIIWDILLPSPISFGHVLQNLQTLSRVENFSLSNRAIEMIPNLRKLKVIYRTDEPTKIWENFCLYDLVRLCQLETLDIRFDLALKRSICAFPENFAFPHKLKKLSLCGCELPWRDMTVVGSLPHLEVLKLNFDAFVGYEWEPVEGEFSRLKFLQMHELDLKYWRAENTHFPRLEQLQMYDCLKLQEIPPGIADIPTLELIEVRSGRRAAYSALQLQEEQRDLENHILQVRVSLRDGYTWRKFTLDELKAMLDDKTVWY